MIKGARMHNLKNVNLSLPRNKLIVITGLSGSGKSSLAFDTLYAEGQRRYVESLSTYARQFLGRLDKPLVDSILGISPAIAIEQKVISKNPRSTVGTATEIYDYLKLLFARIGRTFSPVSGKEVRRHSVTNVVDTILAQPLGNQFYIMAPIFLPEGRSISKHLEVLAQQGFSRAFYKGQSYKFQEIPEIVLSHPELWLIIDRISTDALTDTEELSSRLGDSVQTAFYEGKGSCQVYEVGNKQYHLFSNRFELDGITFTPPDVHLFSFNNPVGACKTCQGLGRIIGVDPNLVIPNPQLSVYENAVVCWNGETMGRYRTEFIRKAHTVNFPVHKPIVQLNADHQKLLWDGNKSIKGIRDFFSDLERQAYKIQYRVLLSRYRGQTECLDCRGSRIRKDAENVKIRNTSIHELILIPIEQVVYFINTLKLTPLEESIAKRLLLEIKNRLQYLMEVGLGYLTLARASNSLSGGESQRISLAASLGSNLTGSIYILDEPSIGLHPRDTAQLIGVLKKLQSLGNTVIVVEHDEDIIRAADEIVDMGPLAGHLGGEVVFQGNIQELSKSKRSLSGDYLSGRKTIPIPTARRQVRKFIEVRNASINNLKNINVRFPLDLLCVVTGVSGSGKSSLVRKVFAPLLQQFFDFGQKEKETALGGDLKSLRGIEWVDQNPIGKSSRSNPVTYIKAYDEIRQFFSQLPLSKIRGYEPSHFSFNVSGGRCDRCEGEGQIIVEMQFMADVKIRCEECGGKRFQSQILEVEMRGKNIADILDLTVQEAIEFFSEEKSTHLSKACKKLEMLKEVGLDYVKLGQPSSTLSGGEAQRIKLADFLLSGQDAEKKLFIFDEPGTGLHFHDILKLLHSIQLLVQRGNTVIIIEHNPEIIKCADWVIDLGPEGGSRGGSIVFEGTPEELVKCKASITGKHLKPYLLKARHLPT